jgi:hypothetical protein
MRNPTSVTIRQLRLICSHGTTGHYAAEFQRKQLDPTKDVLLKWHVPEAETTDDATLQKTQPKSIRLEFKEHGSERFDEILSDPPAGDEHGFHYTSKWLNVAQLLANQDPPFKLKPNTTYSFRIKALSADDDPVGLAYKTITTYPAALPQPVVMKSRTTTSSVTLKWQDPLATERLMKKLKDVFDNSDANGDGYIHRHGLLAAIELNTALHRFLNACTIPTLDAEDEQEGESVTAEGGKGKPKEASMTVPMTVLELIKLSHDHHMFVWSDFEMLFAQQVRVPPIGLAPVTNPKDAPVKYIVKQCDPELLPTHPTAVVDSTAVNWKNSTDKSVGSARAQAHAVSGTKVAGQVQSIPVWREVYKGPALSMTFRNLTQGMSYRWTVQLIDADGRVSEPSPAVIAQTRPAAPSSLRIQPRRKHRPRERALVKHEGCTKGGAEGGAPIGPRHVMLSWRELSAKDRVKYKYGPTAAADDPTEVMRLVREWAGQEDYAGAKMLRRCFEQVERETGDAAKVVTVVSGEHAGKEGKLLRSMLVLKAKEEYAVVIDGTTEDEAVKVEGMRLKLKGVGENMAAVSANKLAVGVHKANGLRDEDTETLLGGLDARYRIIWMDGDGKNVGEEGDFPWGGGHVVRSTVSPVWVKPRAHGAMPNTQEATNIELFGADEDNGDGLMSVEDMANVAVGQVTELDVGRSIVVRRLEAAAMRDEFTRLGLVFDTDYLRMAGGAHSILAVGEDPEGGVTVSLSGMLGSRNQGGADEDSAAAAAAGEPWVFPLATVAWPDFTNGGKRQLRVEVHVAEPLRVGVGKSRVKVSSFQHRFDFSPLVVVRAGKHEGKEAKLTKYVKDWNNEEEYDVVLVGTGEEMSVLGRELKRKGPMQEVDEALDPEEDGAATAEGGADDGGSGGDAENKLARPTQHFELCGIATVGAKELWHMAFDDSPGKTERQAALFPLQHASTYVRLVVTRVEDGGTETFKVTLTDAASMTETPAVVPPPKPFIEDDDGSATLGVALSSSLDCQLSSWWSGRKLRLQSAVSEDSVAYSLDPLDGAVGRHWQEAAGTYEDPDGGTPGARHVFVFKCPPGTAGRKLRLEFRDSTPLNRLGGVVEVTASQLREIAAASAGGREGGGEAKGSAGNAPLGILPVMLPEATVEVFVQGGEISKGIRFTPKTKRGVSPVERLLHRLGVIGGSKNGYGERVRELIDYAVTDKRKLHRLFKTYEKCFPWLATNASVADADDGEGSAEDGEGKDAGGDGGGEVGGGEGGEGGDSEGGGGDGSEGEGDDGEGADEEMEDDGSRLFFDQFFNWWYSTDCGNGRQYRLERDTGLAGGLVQAMEQQRCTPPELAQMTVYKGMREDLMVAGLEPNHLYRFRLTALGRRADSLPCLPLEVMTVPEPPIWSPYADNSNKKVATNAQPEEEPEPWLLEQGSRHVRIRWWPSEGSAAYYVLEMKFVERLDDECGNAEHEEHTRRWIQVYKGGETDAEVENLEANCVYWFRLRAFNSHDGASMYSEINMADTLPLDSQLITTGIVSRQEVEMLQLAQEGQEGDDGLQGLAMRLQVHGGREWIDPESADSADRESDRECECKLRWPLWASGMQVKSMSGVLLRCGSGGSGGTASTVKSVGLRLPLDWTRKTRLKGKSTGATLTVDVYDTNAEGYVSTSASDGAADSAADTAPSDDADDTADGGAAAAAAAAAAVEGASAADGASSSDVGFVGQLRLRDEALGRMPASATGYDLTWRNASLGLKLKRAHRKAYMYSLEIVSVREIAECFASDLLAAGAFKPGTAAEDAPTLPVYCKVYWNGSLVHTTERSPAASFGEANKAALEAPSSKKLQLVVEVWAGEDAKASDKGAAVEGAVEGAAVVGAADGAATQILVGRVVLGNVQFDSLLPGGGRKFVLPLGVPLASKLFLSLLPDPRASALPQPSARAHQSRNAAVAMSRAQLGQRAKHERELGKAELDEHQRVVDGSMAQRAGRVGTSVSALPPTSPDKRRGTRGKGSRVKKAGFMEPTLGAMMYQEEGEQQRRARHVYGQERAGQWPLKTGNGGAQADGGGRGGLQLPTHRAALGKWTAQEVEQFLRENDCPDGGAACLEGNVRGDEFVQMDGERMEELKMSVQTRSKLRELRRRLQKHHRKEPLNAALSVRLKGSLNAIPMGSDERAQFEADFRDDMGAMLGVSAKRIKVLALSPGSVIVHFDILEPLPDEAEGAEGGAPPAEGAVDGAPADAASAEGTAAGEGTAGGAADSAAEGEPETEKKGEQKTADDGRMEFIRLLKQVPCGLNNGRVMALLTLDDPCGLRALHRRRHTQHGHGHSASCSLKLRGVAAAEYPKHTAKRDKLELRFVMELSTLLGISNARVRVADLVDKGSAVLHFEILEDPADSKKISTAEAIGMLLDHCRQGTVGEGGKLLAKVDMHDPLGTARPKVQKLSQNMKKETSAARNQRRFQQKIKAENRAEKARKKHTRSAVKDYREGRGPHWKLAGQIDEPPPPHKCSAKTTREADAKRITAQNKEIGKRLGKIYEADNPATAAAQLKIGPGIDCKAFWKLRTALYQRDPMRGIPGPKTHGIPSTLAYVTCTACGSECFYGADGLDMEICGECEQAYYCSSECKEMDADRHRPYCTKGCMPNLGKLPKSHYWVQNEANAMQTKLLQQRKRDKAKQEEHPADEIKEAVTAYVEEAAAKKAEQAKAFDDFMNGVGDTGGAPPQPTDEQAEAMARAAAKEGGEDKKEEDEEDKPQPPKPIFDRMWHVEITEPAEDVDEGQASAAMASMADEGRAADAADAMGEDGVWMA